ncbi:MAG: hypothetical protein QM784_37240 [Polyangiaceae bacterium]
MAVITLSLEGAAVIVARGLARLARSFRPAAFEDFLLHNAGVAFPEGFVTGELRTRLSKVVESATLLTDLADTVEQAGDTEVRSAGQVLTVAIGDTMTRLGAVADTLRSASGLDATSAARLQALVDGFPRFAAEGAFMGYLELKARGLTQLLTALGLIDQVRVGPAPNTYLSRQLHLDSLGRLLSDPVGLLEERLGWASPITFEPGNKFFDRLELILRGTGLAPMRIREPDGSLTLESPRGTFRVDRTHNTTLVYGLGYEIAADIDVQGSIREGLDARLVNESPCAVGTRIELVPPLTLRVTAGQGGFSANSRVEVGVTPKGSASAVPLLGINGGSRLEAQRVAFPFELEMPYAPEGSATSGEPRIGIRLEKAKAVIALNEGDGFLRSLTSGKPIEASFELAASFGVSSGLRFELGGLSVTLPLHVTFAGVRIDGLTVTLPISLSRPGLPIDFSTRLGVSLGPVDCVVDQIGLETTLSFGGPGPNLGFVDFSAGFKGPSGIGIAVDAGPVCGGGFLSLDKEAGRYSGSLELKVFSISVKAFGLLDTKFPDGHQGYSFVVVIIAEFTPIQLGFGFTLLGVGGLLGINRTVNEDALGDAVRTGSLEHLLFPRNPVADAPAIINDLATVFPASPGHYVLGPMAKLGWGTPTLITANLGIVLELPGPRLALLGVVALRLPSPDTALLSLNMAIAGLLDFPKKKVAIDASLYDSHVVKYSVTGDMAFRLGFGDKANFTLAIGGFNPGFKAPPGFPELRRAAIALGINGNPSLTAQSYFAITSNTAQAGASMELNASGYGIKLHGYLGWDTLFVFSPFSFEAGISAGVDVRFHGVGFGISLRADLSGPSPWHLNGKVCVSVLWWDACLGVDITFGKKNKVSLPEIDPWQGNSSDDARLKVIGLAAAIADSRNWSGSKSKGSFSVVSLAGAASSGTNAPIDPIGAATLRQKVVPLNQKIEKFGEYKPKKYNQFQLGTILVGDSTTGAMYETIEDDFVPAHFLKLSDSQRLSMESYDKMVAGVTIAPNNVVVGTTTATELSYKTAMIADGGAAIAAAQADYKLTKSQLQAMLKFCASARGGIRRSGLQKFVDPTRAPLLTTTSRRYVVVHACSLKKDLSKTSGKPVTHTQAILALRAYLEANPDEAGEYSVVSELEAHAA